MKTLLELTSFTNRLCWNTFKCRGHYCASAVRTFRLQRTLEPIFRGTLSGGKPIFIYVNTFWYISITCNQNVAYTPSVGTRVQTRHVMYACRRVRLTNVTVEKLKVLNPSMRVYPACKGHGSCYAVSRGLNNSATFFPVFP